MKVSTRLAHCQRIVGRARMGKGQWPAADASDGPDIAETAKEKANALRRDLITSARPRARAKHGFSLMSFLVTSIVQRKKVGSATVKAVLMYMSDCASEDGTGIWTSKSNMAADLEMGRRTVQEAIDRLMKAGLVEQTGTRPHPHGITVEYRIVMSAVKALDPTDRRSNTRAGAAPVREPHATRAGAAHHDVREPHTNRPLTVLEPSKEVGADAPTARAKPTADVSVAVDDWNAAAGRLGWPPIKAISDARLKSLAARLKDAGGIEGWRIALGKAEASDFLNARASPHWTGFCFDWAVKAANFAKIMEGNYDNRPDRRHPAGAAYATGNRSTDGIVAAVARREAERADRPDRSGGET